MNLITSIVNLPVEVKINNRGITVYPGGEYIFRASVYNTSRKGITWSVVSGAGTIDADGNYTAPISYSATDRIETIRAAWTPDPTKYAETTLTVHDPREFNVTCNVVQDIGAKKAAIVSLNSDVATETYYNPASGTVITGFINSTTVTGHSFPAVGTIPLYTGMQFLFNGIDQTGEPYDISVTGTISTNGCSGLPTYLTEISDIEYIYSAVVSGVSDKELTGWPSGVVVPDPSTFYDTLQFTANFPSGVALTRNVKTTWLRDTYTYTTDIPKTMDGLLVVTPSAAAYSLDFITRDQVKPVISTVSNGTGTYDGVNKEFTPDVYTPTGLYEELVSTATDITGQSNTTKIYYDLRIDSVSPSSGPFETEITISGGLFRDDIQIYVNENYKIDRFTIAADRKSLTFTLPRVNIGTTTTALSGYLSFKIIYGRVVTDNKEIILIKRLPDIFLLR